MSHGWLWHESRYGQEDGHEQARSSPRCSPRRSPLAATSQGKIDPSQQIGSQSAHSRTRAGLIADVGVAEVVGWKDGETPKVPAGFHIEAMATGLANPRNVCRCPTATCWWSNDSAPAPSRSTVPRTRSATSSCRWPMAAAGQRPRAALRRSGSPCCATPTATASPNCATVLVDQLNAPFGVVAGWQRPLRRQHGCDPALSRSRRARCRSPRRGRRSSTCPAGLIDHHWTKSLTASPDGSKLYAGVGSNSNVQERGPEAETNRAAIWEVDPKTGAFRIFASGPPQSQRADLLSRHQHVVGGGQRARRDRPEPRSPTI